MRSKIGTFKENGKLYWFVSYFINYSYGIDYIKEKFDNFEDAHKRYKEIN